MGAAPRCGVIFGDQGRCPSWCNAIVTWYLNNGGGVFKTYSDRNTTTPTSITSLLLSSRQPKPAVDIRVLQGSPNGSGDNKTLGRFQDWDIPCTSWNSSNRSNIWHLDKNGIVSVKARPFGTQKEQTCHPIELRFDWRRNRLRMMKYAEARW